MVLLRLPQSPFKPLLSTFDKLNQEILHIIAQSILIPFSLHDVLDSFGQELSRLDLSVDGLGTFLVALEWDVNIEDFEACTLDVVDFLVLEDFVEAC